MHILDYFYEIVSETTNYDHNEREEKTETDEGCDQRLVVVVEGVGDCALTQGVLVCGVGAVAHACKGD